MKFDIARQPLIPAFLTLLALTAVAMWGAAKHPAAMAQRYAERIAAYTQPAESAEPAEETEPIKNTGGAAQPGLPAQTPSVPSSSYGTSPRNVHTDDGGTPDRKAQPDGVPTNPTYTEPAAGPKHGAEGPEATHPERSNAAADPVHTGEDGEGSSGTAPVHPATPATEAGSSAPIPGETPQTAAPDTISAARTAERDPASADSIAPAQKAVSPELTAGAMITAEDVPTAADSLTDEPHDRMMIRFPGEWLADFEARHPGGARWIGGLLILFAGLSIGRLTARNNLYSVGTCLAIPLYGILLCGVGDGALLTASAAPALLALATKNYARSFRNGFGFDAIFRASLYLGLLPLVAPAALPLLLLLPLAVQLFRRTLRELAVALAGVMLPLFILCYVNWGAGGDFTAPALLLGQLFCCGPFPVLGTLLPLPKLLFAGAAAVLGLLASLFVFADRYAVGTKPRFVLLLACIMLVLTGGSLCGPAATAETATLLAVPVTLLLPFLFVRIHRSIAAPLYAALLAVAVANAILQ